MLIVFNLISVLMLASGFGLAYGFALLLGATEDYVLLTALTAAFALVFDVVYRRQHPTGHWLSPAGGGHVCFVPVWALGPVWLALLTARSVLGPQLAGVAVTIAFTVAAVAVVSVAVIQARASPTDSGGRPPHLDALDWDCSRCGHRNVAGVRRCGNCKLRV